MRAPDVEIEPKSREYEYAGKHSHLVFVLHHSEHTSELTPSSFVANNGCGSGFIILTAPQASYSG